MRWKERFANIETAESLYLLPVGVIGLYTTYNDWNYLKAIALAYFGHYVFMGLYKAWVNPVKKRVNLLKLTHERIVRDASIAKASSTVSKG